MKKSLVAVFVFSCLASFSYAMDAGFVDVDYDKAGLECVQSLINKLCEKNIDDDRMAAVEEICAAIKDICACEQGWENRNFRKTPARKRELSILFTQLGNILEEQLPSLRIIDEHAGVMRNWNDTSALIDEVVASVREQANVLNGKKIRAVNPQSTAQVLVALLAVLMKMMDMLEAHVAKMPVASEAQIARHDAIQRWGIRLTAVGVCIYLALLSCNAAEYCSVPLPSLVDLLSHFPASSSAV